MTVGTVLQVMSRIKGATPLSQIAVFLTDETRPKLDAVFAATVLTQQKIAAKDASLIGVFDKTMDLINVEKRLRTSRRSVS
jgi:hypothetical protein